MANWQGFGTFWAQEVVVEVGLPGSQATSLLEPSEGNNGGSEGERGIGPRGVWRVRHGDGVNCL